MPSRCGDNAIRAFAMTTVESFAKALVIAAMHGPRGIPA